MKRTLGFFIAMVAAGLAVAGVAQAFIPYSFSTISPPFTYTYIDQNNSTTSIKTSSGVLGYVTVGTAVQNAVVTIYDDAATSTIVTRDNGSITIGATSTATSTTGGTFSVTIDGFIITSASQATGTTASTTASAVATAINASTSVILVTAATSTNSNLITVSSTVTGPDGNPPLNATNFTATSTQNGFSFTLADTPATPIILQFTEGASSTYNAPLNATFNVQFLNGLLITQGGGSSTLSIGSY